MYVFKKIFCFYLMFIVSSTFGVQCNFQMYRFIYNSNWGQICWLTITLSDASGTAIALSNPDTNPSNLPGCVDGNNPTLFGVPDGSTETSFASGARELFPGWGGSDHAFDGDTSTTACTSDRYGAGRCGAPYTSIAYDPYGNVRGLADDFIGYTFTSNTAIGYVTFELDTSYSLEWRFQGCSQNCDVDSGYNSNWVDITTYSDESWTSSDYDGFTFQCGDTPSPSPYLPPPPPSPPPPSPPSQPPSSPPMPPSPPLAPPPSSILEVSTSTESILYQITVQAPGGTKATDIVDDLETAMHNYLSASGVSGLNKNQVIMHKTPEPPSPPLRPPPSA